ncbi:MAG: SDR family oxidoreductase [Proteobacteria bacterium]|nr:SDR family oxidoreductase [Pseudomonadota bacterium]
MDFKLENKVALVTGSYRGTGKAIAAVLSTEGAEAVVHGFERNAAEETAEEIGVKHCVFGDIATDDGAQQVVEQTLELTGRVDILVNNYGTAGRGKWLTTDTDGWIELYQKNVLTAVRMIGLLVPQMKERKSGRIVQIGTIGSTRPNSIMPHYYAAKGALANTTVSLAKELANTGITVNTISPGLIRTDELEIYYRDRAKKKGWGESWEEIEAAVVREEFPNPCGRIASRDDIANLVAFLCSDQAGLINGQNIRVDGGAVDIV